MGISIIILDLTIDTFFIQNLTARNVTNNRDPSFSHVSIHTDVTTIISF